MSSIEWLPLGDVLGSDWAEAGVRAAGRTGQKKAEEKIHIYLSPLEDR
ncbi:MAG: hypothetical protein NZ602_06890 [Thermoguttaceae bacterium]|nr:hypothetical protein [Thermoguttaceae bacterium]MDW8038512.1 hypothetical protein [Thermoguttaceae bacterium]